MNSDAVRARNARKRAKSRQHKQGIYAQYVRMYVECVEFWHYEGIGERYSLHALDRMNRPSDNKPRVRNCRTYTVEVSELFNFVEDFYAFHQDSKNCCSRCRGYLDTAETCFKVILTDIHGQEVKATWREIVQDGTATVGEMAEIRAFMQGLLSNLVISLNLISE